MFDRRQLTELAVIEEYNSLSSSQGQAGLDGPIKNIADLYTRIELDGHGTPDGQEAHNEKPAEPPHCAARVMLCYGGETRAKSGSRPPTL